LFYEDDQARQASSGFFSLQSNKRGKYTGYLKIGSKRHSFSGAFDLQSQATSVVVRRGQTPLNIVLNMGTGETADTITGKITDGTWTASLTGFRTTFNSLTNPAPVRKYTILVPGQPYDSTLPYGHSYGTMKVSSSGIVTIGLKMADGTALARTTRLSKDLNLPLYVSLYSGAGSLISWLGIEDRPTDDCHGDAQWIKPANAANKLFPAGFYYRTEMIGSAYTKPKLSSDPVIPIDGFISFATAGNEFSNGIRLTAAANVASLGPGKMSMQFVPGTGIFQGKVKDPNTGTSYQFGGCVFQKQNGGFGFYKDSQSTGCVTIF
jgi:hypothetical protein